MGTPQHSRTTGQAAADRGWTPARGTRFVVRDGRAITVLRVVTYVLTSLTCLVILAGVVYGALLLRQLPDGLGGLTRLGRP